MKFPVLVKKPVWPSKPLCPQCKKNKVMEPHSMAILAGGAMRVTDMKNKCAEMIDDGAGFLSLYWHGAHASMGGIGVDPEIGAEVSIADWTPSGQFEFYFCSTSCLRAFLNVCVDELEKSKERAFKREIARQMEKATKKLKDPNRLKQLKKINTKTRAQRYSEYQESRYRSSLSGWRKIVEKYQLINPSPSDIGSCFGPGWLTIIDETIGKMITAGWDRKISEVKSKFCRLVIYVDGASPGSKIKAAMKAGDLKAGHACEDCGTPHGIKTPMSGRALCNPCKKHAYG